MLADLLGLVVLGLIAYGCVIVVKRYAKGVFNL